MTAYNLATAHANGDCWHGCPVCAYEDTEPVTCGGCGDPFDPTDAGCLHDGREAGMCCPQAWCGMCRADLAEDHAAEAAEGRWP